MPPGTGPLLVFGLNVQASENTVTPPCTTVMFAEVNSRSLIASVHCGFGQSGTPAMIGSISLVVTLNDTVPFLIWESGIAWLPLTLIGAGFCPGGCVAPAGLVHVELTFAVASSVTRMSPLPSPDNAAVAFSVSPLSVDAQIT